MTRPTKKRTVTRCSAQHSDCVRVLDERVVAATTGAVPLDRVYARVQNHPNRYVSARPLARFVPDLTKKVFQKRGFSSAQLIADWADIIGAQWARQCQPEKLTWPRAARDHDEPAGSTPPGATLVLRTDPAFALEIEYASAQIADRINAHFGYRAITAVKIVQGPLTPPTADTGAVRKRPSAPHRAAPQPGKFLDLLDTIDDRALQAALRRLGTSLANARS